jgi:hypothetical protein
VSFGAEKSPGSLVSPIRLRQSYAARDARGTWLSISVRIFFSFSVRRIGAFFSILFATWLSLSKMLILQRVCSKCRPRRQPPPGAAAPSPLSTRYVRPVNLQPRSNAWLPPPASYRPSAGGMAGRCDAPTQGGLLPTVPLSTQQPRGHLCSISALRSSKTSLSRPSPRPSPRPPGHRVPRVFWPQKSSYGCTARFDFRRHEVRRAARFCFSK